MKTVTHEKYAMDSDAVELAGELLDLVLKRQTCEHLQSTSGTVIAFREDVTPGTFRLDFKFGGSHHILPRQHNLSRDEVLRIVDAVFNHQTVCSQFYPFFDREINQGVRSCQITRLARTRARIVYEMPKAGVMEGWVPYTKVGEMIFIHG